MPAQATAVNDAAGNVDFGRITFTTDLLQDAITTDSGVRTKEFEYKVTESGSAAGVTNDVNASTGKTFKLTLTDDGNGNLTVTRIRQMDRCLALLIHIVSVSFHPALPIR